MWSGRTYCNENLKNKKATGTGGIYLGLIKYGAN